MCLAVPGQLIEVAGDEALASLHGNKLRISTALVPGAQAGDWVLIHAGFAIQKLEGTDLEETWAILQDVADAAGQAEAGGSADAARDNRPSTREVSR
jgi:hydrogenase expression/formation protein HypC